MFPYTVKDNESESDIQNNNYCTKYAKNTKMYFKNIDLFENVENFSKLKTKLFKKITSLFCYLYKFHNSYFENCVFFVIW